VERSNRVAVATAAKQVMFDGMDIVVAGGQENISALQAPYFDWVTKEQDASVLAAQPNAYMPMRLTAEHVARKYGISRDAQDTYLQHEPSR
jgi:acetyl-CoA C-acetyltransferase/acetyl-CoA acyltransferase